MYAYLYEVLAKEGGAVGGGEEKCCRSNESYLGRRSGDLPQCRMLIFRREVELYGVKLFGVQVQHFTLVLLLRLAVGVSLPLQLVGVHL